MSLIKSIELVEYTLTGNTANIGLTKSQDPNYCVPFAMWNTPCTYGSDLRTVCINFYISAGPTLNIERQVTATNAAIKVYVVEFDSSQVSIQQGSFSYSGLSTTTSVSNVTEENAFVISYYKWSGGSSYYYDSLSRTRLTSAIQLTHDRAHDTGTISGNYFIVEDTGGNFTVQHDTLSIIDPATSANLTITEIADERTFIIASYYNHYAAAAPQTSAVSVWLSSTTNIRAEQQLNSGFPADSHIGLQAITFSNSGNVQRGQQSYGTGASNADTSITTVDLDTSIAWIPTVMSLEKTSGTNACLCYFNAELTDSTTIRTERASTGATSTVSWEAITWPTEIYYFDGYVKEEGVEVVRTVRAYRRDTGALAGETTSSGAGGYFYLTSTYSGTQYVVCLDDEVGTSYNLLAYDFVTPTVSG